MSTLVSKTFISKNFDKGWQVLKVLPVGVVLLDKNFRVQFINASASGLLGEAPAKAIGQRFGFGISCAIEESAPKGCLTAKECKDCAMKLAATKALKTQEPLLDQKALWKVAV